MNTQEIPLLLDCQGEQMIGVLHQPVQAHSRGVLIVVGGPQYRVGSHRQFVLLARHLASHGVPVLRFDHRGMGNSQGVTRNFETIGMDIGCAINGFFQHQPDLLEVVIWGLCDAASAAAFYACQDQRIRGLVLLNPWVHTEQGAAKAILKHYYFRRLLSVALWRKIYQGRFEFSTAARSLMQMLMRAVFGQSRPKCMDEASSVSQELPLPERIRLNLEAFQYPILFILSGRDLTADEFKCAVSASSAWKRVLQRKQVACYDLPEADHTFSRQIWRKQIEQWTLAWVLSKN